MTTPENNIQDHYAQIRFIAANYSRLQGLRAIPVGILSVFVSVWALYNHGTTANLNEPILVTILTALLYWVTDRYYSRVYGRVQQTHLQRRLELFASVVFGMLGLLAFILDTTQLLPISTLGLVLATSFLEYFSRVNKSEWKKIPMFFPENIVAAILIIIISLLPLFGIALWDILGIKSQIVGVFMIFGIVIILTGISGHLRMLHALSAVKAKSDVNAI
jgi:hypothetical protein